MVHKSLCSNETALLKNGAVSITDPPPGGLKHYYRALLAKLGLDVEVWDYGIAPCLKFGYRNKPHNWDCRSQFNPKSDSAFPCISAQPLLEPLLNMHTASYMSVITYLNMELPHTRAIPAIHEINAPREVF